jgi:hypothetical protein
MSSIEQTRRSAKQKCSSHRKRSWLCTLLLEVFETLAIFELQWAA